MRKKGDSEEGGRGKGIGGGGARENSKWDENGGLKREGKKGG